MKTTTEQFHGNYTSCKTNFTNCISPNTVTTLFTIMGVRQHLLVLYLVFIYPTYFQLTHRRFPTNRWILGPETNRNESKCVFGRLRQSQYFSQEPNKKAEKIEMFFCYSNSALMNNVWYLNVGVVLGPIGMRLSRCLKCIDQMSFLFEWKSKCNSASESERARVSARADKKDEKSTRDSVQQK